MPNHPAWALQKAVIAALRGHAGLAAIVPPDRVYDAVPARSLYPYIAIGPISVKDRASGGAPAHEQRISFTAFSRSPGFREAYALADAVSAALDGAGLALEGHHLTLLHFDSAEFRREADALTSRAILSFRALTEPE